MKEHFFTINDATYRYTVTGEGKALVLFHGFTGSSATWESFIDAFSHAYQVITVDLPGHGKTTAKTPRTMETFSYDMSKLIQHLQHEKVHLLGYSMGGRSALSFAMYYPELVATLMLESASPGLKTEEERTARQKQDTKLADKLMTEGVPAFVAYWEKILLFDTQKTLPEKTKEQIRHERLSHTKEGLADSLKFMGTGKQPSWWEKLSELDVPVLLMAGEMDEKFVQINRLMDEAFPESEIKLVKNAGHAIHVEQPEKFVTIVKEFMFRHKQKYT